LINSGNSSWSRMAEVLSINPAKIAGDAEQGQEIKVGAIANLALIDPTVKRKVVADSASKSKNSPYVGLELPGFIQHTIYRGYFTVRNGQLAEKGRN